MIVALSVAFAITAARSDWFIAQNPVTGNPEAVWSNPQSGGSSDVLYSYLDGASWAPSTNLSSIGKESPVLAFDPNGARKVAWGTSETTGRILLRTQAASGGAWSSEIVISDPSEASSQPSAIVSDENTYVSYEAAATGGARSVICGMIDPGSNVGRTLVTSTSYNSPLVPLIHSDQGYLWIDWIDSSSYLGYSVLTKGEWKEVSYESYTGESDIKDGRERIRANVLAGQ